MNWERVIKNFADAARPFNIYLLGGSIGGGMFAHADAGLMTIVAGVFGLLIGARSVENVFQTKADVATKKNAADAATEDKKTEANKPGATQ